MVGMTGISFKGIEDMNMSREMVNIDALIRA
jgi:hypothetical protein